MDTKNSLIQTADEILIKLARNEITHSDPQVKIAILIKESFPVTNLATQPLRFASFKKERPVMLETCVEVYEYMVSNGATFSWATSDIAEQRNIRNSTVRQACCGNLGLAAENWNKFYESKYQDYSEIKDALLRVYPEHILYIEANIN